MKTLAAIIGAGLLASLVTPAAARTEKDLHNYLDSIPTQYRGEWCARIESATLTRQLCSSDTTFVKWTIGANDYEAGVYFGKGGERSDIKPTKCETAKIIQLPRNRLYLESVCIFPTYTGDQKRVDRKVWKLKNGKIVTDFNLK